ncbi:MAG: glycosyltransferase family 4 protein [Bacteroides sp.]|nr:glycosyltransferase family 4 protein [Bacteroides sp.]
MIHIALITYDISPVRGSEAAVSWNFVQRMSRHVNITVIYGHGCSEVENYIAKNPIDNVSWINIPTPIIPHGGLRWHIENYFNYRQWHKDAEKIIRQLVESNQIQLIHYLNPIGFKEPGDCWKINGVPYVWGPIQGVENRPLSLLKAFNNREKIGVILRRIIHNSMFRFQSRFKKALKRTDFIFGATPNTISSLKNIHGIDAVYLPENGILSMERNSPIHVTDNDPVRLIFVGMITDRKGLRILLDALRKVRSKNWHLDIVGDGPLKNKLERQYCDLKDNLTWHGRLTRENTQKVFNKAHLHIITSLGEANTTVIWEAMAKAIPTLTLDHCGMSAIVCDKCGIKIPISDYDSVVNNISQQIDELTENPERIEQMSAGVITCCKKFMWDNRIPLFLETYSTLINKYENQNSL